MQTSKFILLLLLFAFFSENTHAQSGYSSQSISRSRQQTHQPPNKASSINQNQQQVNAYYPQNQLIPNVLPIPSPEEITVEEYMNYHRHKLNMPENSENVGVNVHFAKAPNLKSDEAIIQIGFATRRLGNEKEYLPANICLVVDRGGSMDGEKMDKSKMALKEFVQKLRPQDYISIVIFDHLAEVLLPPTKAVSPAYLMTVIDKIEVRGSTDLNAGIKLGYEQVAKMADKKFGNRVLLLSDALPNTGETNPDQIARTSSFYRETFDIEFVMVGVGDDYNYVAAKTLTQHPRCQTHFIYQADDIIKTFRDEAESLIAPVAKSVVLDINLGKKYELITFYGYENVVFSKNNIASFFLKDMNAGLTQIVMMKVREIPDAPENMQVNLKYWDVMKQKNITKQLNPSLISTSEAKVEQNSDVLKNYVISELALSLKEMAKYYQNGDAVSAYKSLQNALSIAKQNEHFYADEDVKRMREIVSAYKISLQNYAKPDQQASIRDMEKNGKVSN